LSDSLFAATVFIVDDDPAVRDSLRTLLECHGIGVCDFASGAAFLDSYGLGSLGRGCLLLDIHMPSLDGFAVLQRLAAAGRAAIPTLLMTGKVDMATRRRAQQSSAAGLLEKPLEENVLITAIRRLISS
jgi:FixJ family two-component response regulator